MQPLEEKKQKIVVIDDEPITLKLIIASLKDIFDVLPVSNVTDAIEICERELPDLILLDLILPNIDGFEMLQRLKNHNVLCKTPVVCMSSTNSYEYRDRTRNGGASGFITKPVNIKTLEKDLLSILHSLHKIEYSKNKRICFQTVFNAIEKSKTIEKLLESFKTNEKKVIVLSWQRGDDFLESSPHYQDQIETDKMIYLEIKPNVMSKFPFLQDLSPIVADIDSFVNDATRNYHLVFEEPRHLFNFSNEQKSMTQAYQLGALFNNHFASVNYVNTLPTSQDDRTVLNTIGKILINLR